MITTDTEHICGNIMPAYDVVKRRLEFECWDLYERTRFRKFIAKEDRLAFYVGGRRKNKGMVISTAVVDQVVTSPRKIKIDEQLLVDKPVAQLLLTKISYIEPLNLREKFFELEMSSRVKKTLKWGSALMGGAKQLSDKDWKFLELPKD